MRDRDLVRLYWPVELRPAFDALFAIDDAMGDIVAKASEPALAAIKLAWWRERLQELDEGKVPAEPRLQQAATELTRRGVSGASLAELEGGWLASLGSFPWGIDEAEAVAGRGRQLFGLAGMLLTNQGRPWGGEAWSLVTATRLCPDDQSRQQLMGLVSKQAKSLLDRRSPSAFRPITMFASLALRDLKRGGPPFEPEASPARAWTLLRHRLTGRFA